MPLKNNPLARAPQTNTHSRAASRAQVAGLRQEVARLQLLLQASEAKVAMWEECMQQLVHCVMLSPDMNDIYKTECSTLLRDALTGVEQIQAVRFVDCSFPSVPAEAPHIQLIRWESMQDSEWQLRWAPSWSVQVAVEGQQYVSFSLMLRLYDLRLSGRITLKMSTDLSKITISFKQPPKLRLKTECTVSWGSVPLPLQTYIETVVQDEFQRASRTPSAHPTLRHSRPRMHTCTHTRSAALQPNAPRRPLTRNAPGGSQDGRWTMWSRRTR